MRRSSRALGAMFMCAAAAAAAASCRGCVRERVEVTRLLSREAANAVVVPAPSATLQRLRKLLGRFEGSSVGEQAKDVVRDLSGRLGFNPFDRGGWLKAGLDPDKGLAVTLETVKKEGKDVDVPLFVIGVDDAGTFDKTVRRLAKEQERAELYGTQGYKQSRITTILRQTPAGDRPLFAYAVYEGYAVFGDAAGGVDAIRRLVDRRLQNGLDSAPSYKRMLGKARTGADVHVFVNEGAGADKVPLMSRRAAEMFRAAREHFKGMLAALSIENGFSLEVFLGLSDSAAATAASYMAGTPKLAPAMLKTVSEDALAVFKGSADLQKLYAKMKRDAPAETFQLNKAIFGWMQKFAEIDPDEKIIPALSGDLTYAVFPGNLELAGEVIAHGIRGGAHLKLVNLAYAVSLRDPARASAAMLEFENGLRAHGVAVTERQVNAVRFKTAQIGSGFESAWTFKDRLFLGAYGPGRLERAVGLAGGAPGGILEKVSGDSARDLLLSDGSEVLYVNFGSIARALKSVKKEHLGVGSGTLFVQSFLDLVKDVLARLADGVVAVRAAPGGLKLDVALNFR
ncbi:MAG: hypothetical protein HY897_11955 [Deltaproteobacteria bacterium]|nr:hypothetical protein [Deltaproteobacteria bacterium]